MPEPGRVSSHFEWNLRYLEYLKTPKSCVIYNDLRYLEYLKVPEPSPVWSRFGAGAEPGRSRRWQALSLSKHTFFNVFFMTWQALSLSNVAKLLTQNSKLRGIWQAQSLSNVSKLWTQNSEFRAIWQALSLSNVPTLWAHNSKLRAQNSKLRAQELWWELNRVYIYICIYMYI